MESKVPDGLVVLLVDSSSNHLEEFLFCGEWRVCHTVCRVLGGENEVLFDFLLSLSFTIVLRRMVSFGKIGGGVGVWVFIIFFSHYVCDLMSSLGKSISSPTSSRGTTLEENTQIKLNYLRKERHINRKEEVVKF